MATYVNDKNYEKFITQLYIKLKREILILLKPMSKEEINNLLSILKKYLDIKTFIIGSEGKEQLVLRYTPYFKQYVDVKGLLDSGKKYYFERNYDKCIECYKKTLQFGEPSISAYVRIGLSYYRKFERELAADYLTIATELSKKRDKKYDFSDMIMRLNGEIKEEDKKTRVIINEEEFKYGNYNINNLNDVAEYIYNTNKKVSDVCKELGMNTEEINLVILLYAKRYYIQGDYEKGEEFLKAVEKNKEKTDKVRKALDEIKRNKKLYMNKHSDYNLKLTLKP